VQANCPSCAQRIVIDDAKVPDRAFSVKCPKCQTVVRFPGRGAQPVVSAPGTSSFATSLPAGAYPAAPATSAFPAYPAAPASAAEAGSGPTPPPAPPPPAAAPPSEEVRAQMMAQLRRELSLGDSAKVTGRAVVALPDRAKAGAMALPLTRIGYQVDTVDNPEDGSRLVEQGVYDLVVATRAAAGAGRESLYQRLNRLSPDARRRMFVVLVGDEFKTGDATQAWASMADLVVSTRDIPNADASLLPAIAERTRLYQVYTDARKRYEATTAS
jgi:predicted Zn finger-like uncharacterized protein